MRHSNQPDRGLRLPPAAAGVAALVVVAIVAACGSSATPPPSPTVAPTPVVTPDPHLKEPVTADQIFQTFGAAQVGITANNANNGNGNPAIIKEINADVGGWPLRITQYRTSALLQDSLHWKAGQAPGGDEPPYSIAGLNILIEYGPISAAPPSQPDPTRAALAARLVSVLDPLLWPLDQHSVLAIPSRTPEPTPAPSVAPSARPSKAPTAKPTPTKKPVKRTPKPSPRG